MYHMYEAYVYVGLHLRTHGTYIHKSKYRLYLDRPWYDASECILYNIRAYIV